MGRVTLQVYPITRAGQNATPTPIPAAGGAIDANDGLTFFEVTNSDYADHVVSVRIAQTVDEQPVVSLSVTVPAQSVLRLGSYPTNVYNQELAQAASGTLTSNGTLPSDGDSVQSDGLAYFFKTALTAIRAGGTLTSDATTPTNGDTVTINGTTYTLKTALTEQFAAVTLTSDGTAPADGDTVTFGAAVFKFKTALTERHASATLTSDGTAPADGDTVTIDKVAYKFKTTLTGAAYEVHIGGSAAAALTNLKAALNHTGTVGTDYGTGTLVHPRVSGGTLTGTTLVAQSLTLTLSDNTKLVAETSAHLSWSGYTLCGTIPAVTNEVLIGASAAAALTNLKAAVNADPAGTGSLYSTGTAGGAPFFFLAGTLTGTTLVIRWVVAGTAGNGFAVAESSAHLSFGSGTLSGGVNPGPAGEVLIGGSAANALTNLKSAINNVDGTSGISYSSQTVAHTSFGADTLTGTTLHISALIPGTAYNGSPTTETSTHLAWGSGTTSGGVDSLNNEVLIGGTVAITLQRLADAINGATGLYTNYFTFAPAPNSSATVGATTLTVTATVAGIPVSAISFLLGVGSTLTVDEASAATGALTGGLDAGAVLFDVDAADVLQVTAYDLTT